MLRYRGVVFVVLLLLPLIGTAQYQIGLTSDRYSGVNALWVNPANLAHTPHNWEINLVGAGFFLENNYLYLENANTPRVLSNLQDINVPADIRNAEIESPEPAITANFLTNNKPDQAFVSAQVFGPSVFFRVKGRHNVGIFTSSRVMSSVRGVDTDLDYYAFDSLDLYTFVDISGFKANALAWNEIGGTYAHTFAFGPIARRGASNDTAKPNGDFLDKV